MKIFTKKLLLTSLCINTACEDTSKKYEKNIDPNIDSSEIYNSKWLNFLPIEINGNDSPSKSILWNGICEDKNAMKTEIEVMVDKDKNFKRLKQTQTLFTGTYKAYKDSIKLNIEEDKKNTSLTCSVNYGKISMFDLVYEKHITCNDETQTSTYKECAKLDFVIKNSGITEEEYQDHSVFDSLDELPGENSKWQALDTNDRGDKFTMMLNGKCNNKEVKMSVLPTQTNGNLHLDTSNKTYSYWTAFDSKDDSLGLFDLRTLYRVGLCHFKDDNTQVVCSMKHEFFISENKECQTMTFSVK